MRTWPHGLRHIIPESPAAPVVSTLFISLDGVAEIDRQRQFPNFDEAMGNAVGVDYAGTEVLVL